MIERYLPNELLGALNGSIFLLLTMLWIFLSLFILRKLQGCGLRIFNPFTWCHAYQCAYDDVAIASPLWTATIGQAVIRGDLWVGRIYSTHLWGNIDTYRQILLIGLLIGAAFLYAGTLCMFRVLIEGRYGNWVWIVAGTVSVVLGTIPMYY